jgi:hypothetical protein
MKHAAIAAMILASGGAMAQGSSTITNGTQSTAQQATNVNVNVGSNPGGAPNAQPAPTESTLGYTGSYSVKSAPTVYAPSLTASVTETCWGSVSAAISVVGVGATGAATIKDADCNRRLNAAIAWRMDRKDIAFNIMCQDESFRAAAAKTNAPCVDDRPKPDVTGAEPGNAMNSNAATISSAILPTVPVAAGSISNKALDPHASSFSRQR